MAAKPGSPGFDLTFFVPNEAWELTETKTGVKKWTTAGQNSCPDFIIKVRRRSSYYVLNLILPVLLLSFLNNFVFLIPDESGEKIGYGITVLLSMSVYLTVVSTMVPRVSNNITAVSIYLFVLLSASVLSVVESIVTVYLHHAEEDEKASLKAQENYKKSFKKVINLNLAVRKMNVDENVNDVAQTPSRISSSPAMDQPIDQPMDQTPDQAMTSLQDALFKNKYRVITRQNTNKVCLVTSITIWIITQMAYFIYVHVE